MPKPKALYCSYHCAGCGAHFRSLKAFDAHRQGSHQLGERHCVDPDLIDGFVANEGVCRIGDNFKAPKSEVLVYGDPEARERTRKAFSQPPRV